MTEDAIIRARIAELTKMLADLQARLRLLQIEKAMFSLHQKREAATQLN